MAIRFTHVSVLVRSRLYFTTIYKQLVHTTLQRASVKLVISHRIHIKGFLHSGIYWKIIWEHISSTMFVRYHQITRERGASTKNARAPSIKPQLNYQGWALL